MGVLYGDAKVSLRLIFKAKGFALVSILLLGLGIGLNMTLFSVANSVLFRPMTGVKEAEGLAMIGRTNNGRGFDNTNWPVYSELRKGSQLFSELAAYDLRAFSLAVDGRTERLSGSEVTENYFSTLGVQPAMGRLFRPDEGQKPGADPVAVLSYSYWKSRFGGDPKLVGKAVRVNGHPFTIIGIAEEGFRGHEIRQGDMWILLPTTTIFSGSDEFMRNFKWSQLLVVGRLKPGVTHSAAQQELQAIFQGLQRRHPVELENRGLRVTQYHPLGQPHIRDLAVRVFGVFGILCSLILLSVCANLGGVVLARALARQREFAIRLSLGAGRWQLVRQMLVEAMLLTVPGALLGLVLASWTGDVFLSSLPVDGFTVKLDLSPDWRSLSVFAALNLFSLLSFVTPPMWQSLRVSLQPMLKGGEGSVSAQSSWIREALVFVQVFACVVLLCGAALLGKTLWNLNQVDLNMKPDHLLSVAIHPGLNGYKTVATKALFSRVQQGIEALPGVVSATSSAVLPLSGREVGLGPVHGGKLMQQQAFPFAVNLVGPRYFETMGIPLLRGRDIDASDLENSQKVAVINQAMAEQFFGESEAVGKSIFLESDAVLQPLLVVGIAANSSFRDLSETPKPMYFVPVQQYDFKQQSFLIRTHGDPLSLLESVRKTIAGFDPNLPLFEVKTMEDQVESAAWPWKAMSLVSVAASGIAAAIAFVGLFGVIAWTVARRTREIGLKLALGASSSSILRETIWRGARSAILASGIGLGFSLLAAGQLGEFLVGVDPHDPLIFLSIAIGFTLVIALAVFAPARKALHISPMDALRHE